MMKRRTRRTASAVPLLAFAAVAVLAVAGCSEGGGTQKTVASAGKGSSAAPAPASDQMKRYRTCMESKGIPMYLNPEGVAVIDKEKADAGKVNGALAACRSVQPAETQAPAPPADFVARQRRYSACIRQHGMPRYPDPDPVTGEVNLEALGSSLKTDPAFKSAMNACRTVGLPNPTGSSAALG